MGSGWPCVLARVVMLEEGPPASCRGPARWEGCTLSIYTPGPGPRDYGCPRWGGQAPVALRLALPSRRPLSYPAGPCGHDQEEDSGLGAGRVYMAFGSLLKEGIHVRLSGQDVERGTFR